VSRPTSQRSMEGTNTAGLQMPAMNLQWSYLSVLGGLLFSTRRPRWLGFNRRQINDLHRRCLGRAQMPMDDTGRESA
jgi:hypothetical protein